MAQIDIQKKHLYGGVIIIVAVLAFFVLSNNTESPQVKIETTKGDIIVALNEKESPVTVENFLSYVDSGFYDGLVFHRVIPGFMIQGGGFTETKAKKETREPIILESQNGLSNNRGTIAMARTNDPNSATSQFFINVVDNTPLNYNNRSRGYAVFGEVVSGMDVVDMIAQTKTDTINGYDDWPVEDVVILSISRI